MTNTKSTKRALLVSVMAMVICFTMLLGTTFAWFTDSDGVAGNVIAAGTLKIGLEGGNVNINKAEPGYVYIQNLSVSNNGTLAFNYKLRVERTAPNTSTTDLANVVEVYYVKAETSITADDRTAINALLADANTKHLGTLAGLIDGTDDFFGASTLTAGAAAEKITLIYVIPTSVENEYQGTDAGTFTVKVLAAQLASEPDSVNNKYDAGSEYDEDYSDPNPLH